MRALIAIGAVLIAIGPGQAALSTSLQSDGVPQKPATRVVIFAVEGMT
jgi:hypothetical protein